MTSILITGGAGFIGSNFIKYLLQNSDFSSKLQIINVDNLTYAGNLNNLKEVENHKNYHFIKGDINDKTLIYSIFTKYRIKKVINFAAESHVDRAIIVPNIFVKTNVLGTTNLLICAKEYWEKESNTSNNFHTIDNLTSNNDNSNNDIINNDIINNDNITSNNPTSNNLTSKANTSKNNTRNNNNPFEDKLFIQISTDEVYGSLPENEPDKFFTELSQLEPHSPYSASKAGADLLVKSFYDTYKFPAIITRCSNNYGPYQFPEKLIPLIIKNALSDKSIPVYGDGNNIRDWIYVEDHCAAIANILLAGKVGEIYNIGASCEKKNIEVVKTILDILEKPYNLIEYVTDRLGHDRRYAVDAGKIRQELGWQPKQNFEENIAKTINWYINNPEHFG